MKVWDITQPNCIMHFHLRVHRADVMLTSYSGEDVSGGPIWHHQSTNGYHLWSVTGNVLRNARHLDQSRPAVGISSQTLTPTPYAVTTHWFHFIHYGVCHLPDCLSSCVCGICLVIAGWLAGQGHGEETMELYGTYFYYWHQDISVPPNCMAWQLLKSFLSGCH